MFAGRFNKRSVFITGHTGFKGSWLCSWLLSLGAQVTGYARNPEPHERLYGQLNLRDQIDCDIRADICDAVTLRRAVLDCQPDFIFHLAAQPLVRKSFEIPIETFQTNVMGTANLLDAVRHLSSPCTVIVVTTDKCYENREWVHSYREEDAMGGYDPYSASKGCAELVTQAYRRSYFPAESSVVSVASARAGNVIGGGDWAEDRIVPDIFRALQAGETIPVRNKVATRPWQHVLEPLSGYLWLAACLDDPSLSPFPACQLRSSFNFGPHLNSNRTVADLVDAMLQHTAGTWEDHSDPNAPHEATKLNLAIDKAHHILHWKPNWGFEETIRETVQWYLDEHNGDNVVDVTNNQIALYQANALQKHLAWSSSPS
ncbi:CDP-glucose 4,6-dehydratase [Novipirellula sp.]|uniref:CDP-glucose 4,6-dehydratase n=1 Tax=Novipirellula sp. TaxID=2795430 RepID=UPI003561D206